MTGSNYRLFCWLGLLLAFVPRQLPASDDPLSIGPLYDHFALTLDPGDRTELLGPLFYSQTKDSEHTFAVPPLFSHVSDSVTDFEETDVLYPLLTYDRFGSEYRWQLFQLFSFAGGNNQDETRNKRFTLFPIYFQQRSPDPEKNYTALFPIYGHLQNRLFRDRIFFVMFPIYGQSEKRGVVTDNYLYPIGHVRHGAGLKGWQVWPFAGHEHKEVTIHTNNFGDPESIPGHDKTFAAWPLYFHYFTGIGSENPAEEFSLIPFYSSLRSPYRDSTSVLWPFFNVIDDREKKYHEWQLPWPLIVFARGEGKTTSRVLPFFSRSHNDTIEINSYLWPIYRYKHFRAGAFDRQRTQILFFLFSNVQEKNIETGARRTRTDLLGIFTHHREFNGNTRLQLIAPIEPVLPNNKSVERNWSPVWSVWRSEYNPTTDASSQSLLWNLYRRDATPAVKKCSLLFGIFQYQSSVEARRLRLFFIPVLNLHRSTATERPETEKTKADGAP